MKTISLDKIKCKCDWTKEELHRKKTIELLICQISTLQSNLAQELEGIYKDHGFYNYSIKKNHKRIQELVKENVNQQFYRGLTDEQGQIFSNNAEDLERLVYVWAGLAQAKEEWFECDGVNLNLVARQSFDTAKKRGKINNYTSDIMQLDAIKAELNELRSASTNPSIHLEGYTEQEEEAADVIISTLTFLSMKGVSNINKLLMKKMKYNQNRED